MVSEYLGMAQGNKPVVYSSLVPGRARFMYAPLIYHGEIEFKIVIVEKHTLIMSPYMLLRRAITYLAKLRLIVKKLEF
ncbi:hypothetical protein ACH5RR_018372 [Cinchona calisaya]|uniref:Uncharacterized protein n=1 Tax=Cinchona calisaya TaxID=153742 RepID=A0ABD2ZMJ1_9GENT